MAIERVIYCDGPDCDTHIRTASLGRVPIGFIEAHEGTHEGVVIHEFCGWDCVMRFAATLPAPEIIELD